MTTPTYDEIVVRARNNIDKREPWPNSGDYMREALRLAREGLPLQDVEATTLAREIAGIVRMPGTIRIEGDIERPIYYHQLLTVIRTFLAKRDAERDAEVESLVQIAKIINRRRMGCDAIDYDVLEAAIAKLERKS
jgi:hypothetical protein